MQSVCCAELAITHDIVMNPDMMPTATSSVGNVHHLYQGETPGVPSGGESAVFKTRYGWIRVVAVLIIGALAIGALNSPFAARSASTTARMADLAVTDVVSAGDTVAVTVTLRAAAPKGGVVIDLASSNRALSVPASITIRAGKSAATVNATTSTVSARTKAVVSATLGGVTKSETVVINPVRLKAISAPATVQHGASAEVTVSLTAPAPAGGLTVRLVGNRPSVLAVPETLAIPAGSSSANATVSAFTPRADADVTLTAKLSGSPNATTVTTVLGTGYPDATATPTETAEPTATNTAEPTATHTPEPTATNTEVPTATNTPEPTATDTPEPTATHTEIPTATNTPVPTATATATPVVHPVTLQFYNRTPNGATTLMVGEAARVQTCYSATGGPVTFTLLLSATNGGSFALPGTINVGPGTNGCWTTSNLTMTAPGTTQVKAVIQFPGFPDEVVYSPEFTFEGEALTATPTNTAIPTATHTPAPTATATVLPAEHPVKHEVNNYTPGGTTVMVGEAAKIQICYSAPEGVSFTILLSTSNGGTFTPLPATLNPTSNGLRSCWMTSDLKLDAPGTTQLTVTVQYPGEQDVEYRTPVFTFVAPEP
jgi:hypothetical protein